jgi:hypothetical protein
MIDVRVAPLDDFLDRIEGRLALKVDTQGAEPFVVAGARACLPRSDFSMEFCPYLMRQLGSDPGIVMDLVAGFDRVPIMDKTWTPRYCSPGEAREMLESKLRTAADTDEDHLDILATRNVV